VKHRQDDQVSLGAQLQGIKIGGLDDQVDTAMPGSMPTIRALMIVKNARKRV
jgi:hypothetical protein